MKTRLALVLLLFLILLILGSKLRVLEPQARLDPVIAADVGRVLEGYRVADLPGVTKELPAQHWRVSYRDMVNVPVVVSASGVCSSVVVVNQNNQVFVVTSPRVVHNSLRVGGRPMVFLLFFNLALKNETFTAERFAGCMTSDKSPSDWCQAVRHSARLATVERTDPFRNLALLAVNNVPSGVTGIRAGDIQMLQPGDSVVVIGHPGKLLWSSTTGIIRAVQRFPDGENGLETVIHMQAPVDAGASGGPLISSNGTLAGVVVGELLIPQSEIPAVRMPTVPAEGLHYAVGIDQVLRFLGSEHR
jgi:hypothetical protein